jgi:heme-degrading monooxygenase HmoA/ketosteroid isomerase-like protein
MITASLSSLAEPYFRAWNSHDPDGIAAALAEGGTYTDPTISGAPLTGAQIAGHARAVLTAFPDLSFEVLGSQRVANGTEVVRWLMRGTNTGPLRVLFQTGRSVALPGVTGRSLALPGVDVITVADGKIGSVQGYFDRQTMAEQLGLQVIVQPHAVGPLQFGYAVRAAGGSQKIPGAVSLTWLDSRSEEEAQEVRELTRQIVGELAKAPGFIGWLGVVIAGQMYTITTWETEDAVRAVMRSSAHQVAVKRLLTEDFCADAATSVWVPHHINALWTRCTCCGGVSDLAQNDDSCGCGQPLPQAHW